MDDKLIFMLKNYLLSTVRDSPAFFSGVTNVVLRLLNIIQPNVAVFGRKDFQQCVIIQKMITDLFLPIRFISSPIIRSKKGLALSSRNSYLTPTETIQAETIYKSLKNARDYFISKQNLASSELITYAKSFLDTAITIDYFLIVNSETLLEEPYVSQIIWLNYYLQAI